MKNSHLPRIVPEFPPFEFSLRLTVMTQDLTGAICTLWKKAVRHFTYLADGRHLHSRLSVTVSLAENEWNCSFIYLMVSQHLHKTRMCLVMVLHFTFDLQNCVGLQAQGLLLLLVYLSVKTLVSTILFNVAITTSPLACSLADPQPRVSLSSTKSSVGWPVCRLETASMRCWQVLAQEFARGSTSEMFGKAELNTHKGPTWINTATACFVRHIAAVAENTG